jgi:hypothetical protein
MLVPRTNNLESGIEVEVRTHYLSSWVSGFEIVAVEGDRVRLRRRSDGVALPVAMAADDVRPHRDARGLGWCCREVPKMIEHPNARPIYRGYEAFALRDLEILREFMTDDVIQGETDRRGDRTLDVASTVEFEIDQNKITEVTVYQADAYTLDDFWS